MTVFFFYAAAQIVEASGNYVIITTRAIVDSSTELPNLVNQERDEGYRVALVTEDEWGASGADERAENIRAWLKEHYKADSIRYVLLIGNPDPLAGDVPMKLCYYDITVETFLDREIPTDFYYSELSGTWDANGDGYYGDVNTDYGVSGGADHHSEVSVGRIPYYGVMEDLDHIIRKSIDYRNETSREWRKNALLAMRPTHEKTTAYPLGEAIKDSILIPASWNYYRIYDRYNSYADAYLDELYDFSPPVDRLSATETNMQEAWAGTPFGFCIWWSHGSSPQSVIGIFRSNRAQYLDDRYPSMVFQVSCSSAFPEDTFNLAYALLRQGAVTVAGPTRETNSYIGQTSFKDSPSNSGMGYMYAYYMIHDKMSAGDALRTVRDSTSKNHWWPNILTYSVYGCPDLKLETEPTTLAQIDVPSLHSTRELVVIIDTEKGVCLVDGAGNTDIENMILSFYDLSGRLVSRIDGARSAVHEASIPLPEVVRSSSQTMIACLQVGKRAVVQSMVRPKR